MTSQHPPMVVCPACGDEHDAWAACPGRCVVCGNDHRVNPNCIVATSAAEYAERTRDELRQIELHPADCGAIDLDAFQALTADERRRTWMAASDGDRRGLALQIIRRGQHGPDEATIQIYLEQLDHRFGPSPVERAVMGALERLATQEAASARAARAAGEMDDAKFFQRSANAYCKALRYYRDGVRPEPTPSGYTLPSQRVGEAPHLLTMDGDWICTCPAGSSMHWAKALIVGIEVAGDDLDRFDGGDEPSPAETDQQQIDAHALEHAAAIVGITEAMLGRRLTLARARLIEMGVGYAA